MNFSGLRQRTRRVTPWVVMNAILATTLLLVLVERVKAQSEPLRVCVTTPDLGSLVREIGGDQVTVTEFTKGPQDPHYVEAKPSFIKQLNRAEFYVENGLDLEVGWAPVLLRAARNLHVARGARGFVDPSSIIIPLQTAKGVVDRSQGDVHPLGNPHYLLDPLNGLKVATLLESKLSIIRPRHKAAFRKRHSAFKRRLASALLGEEIFVAYPGEQLDKLLLYLERGGIRKFLSFLQKQGQLSLLSGWLGVLRPHLDQQVVADHNLWPYFARRFGLKVLGFLEPKPGIAPTTKHLAALIQQMKEAKVRAILSSPYFNVRHARFIARQTATRVAAMAHQVGARPGTDTYVEMIHYNVYQLKSALEATP